ncbi:DUF4382 domain-containing protein [Candidatus Woesearchaeota archaeon]|nr:DUF4382 domain-containing protein [Candidatus Woesearchaeota archaeon]
MHKRWVIAFVLACVIGILLAGCAKKAVESAPENKTSENESFENVTAPVQEEELGRVVFGVKDKAVDREDITKFDVEISNLEVHTGGDEAWTKLSSGKVTYDLIEAGNLTRLLLDVPLEPAKYTQIRFQLDAEATIAGTDYDLEVPSSFVRLAGVIDVEAGKTAAAILDFELDRSVFLAGENAYFKPVIHVTTYKDADVEAENNTFKVKSGEKVTDDEQGPEDIWTKDQLNNSNNDCLEDCEGYCDEQASASCESECKSKTALGCDSEDEDICRETCEGYLHPVDCRDGCQEDNSTDCTEYLENKCALGCNETKSTCKSSCQTDCEVNV